MPLRGTFGGLSSRAFGFGASLVNRIYDNFLRTTSGTLGDAVTGQVWSNVVGVWFANGSAAQTNTSPSSYPMAIIPFLANIVATLDNVSEGGGIAFWETDAGDWWAACTTGSYNTTCFANACCSGSNTCVSNSCCSYASCPPGCAQTGFGSCYSLSTGFPCSGGGCIASACCTGSNSCASNSCCTSSTTWSWTLNILQSVASTVSNIVSSVLATSSTATLGINSISLVTSGNNVTATGYSDTSTTTAIGSVNTTNSGTKGIGTGIIMTPGGDGTAQGTTVGPFTAT